MKKTVLIILYLIITSSCVTNRKLTYLSFNGMPDDTLASITPSDYRILPYDNLYIRVITPDPQWAAMFNTMPVSNSSINVTEQSADLVSYPVSSSGTIIFPYAGEIHVAGKSLNVIAAEVEEALKSYVTNPSVTVKMVNNYVSLIGEVTKPGRYAIYKDRLNIFQALAMGGDLNEYSNRQKIQILRQTKDGNIIREFSLTDRSIMTSEFYYVMPNDVIYAKPMKGKFFQMNAFPYSVILSTITTFVLILNVLK